MSLTLTLLVTWSQARMQYEAYCHECKAVVATWTAEWLTLHQKEPPIGWEHICPSVKLLDHGPSNPSQDTYEGTNE